MLEEDESEGHLGLSLDYELLAQRTLKDRGFIWRVFKIFFSTADTGQCELKISSRISYPLSFFLQRNANPVSWKKEKEVSESCLTLCDPKDCSLPGSSIHGIFQARVMEWVAISFSSRSSWPRDQTRVSYIVRGHFSNSEPLGKPSFMLGISNWDCLISKKGRIKQKFFENILMLQPESLR